MLSFTGLMGLFPAPSVNTAALRAVCLDCQWCVCGGGEVRGCMWISGRLGYSVRHKLNVPTVHSLARSLKHLFIYPLNNFFTQSLAWSFMRTLIHPCAVCSQMGRTLQCKLRETTYSVDRNVNTG